MHFRQLNLLAFLLHTFKAAICWQKLILLCCNVKVSGVGFFSLYTEAWHLQRGFNSVYCATYYQGWNQLSEYNWNLTYYRVCLFFASLWLALVYSLFKKNNNCKAWMMCWDAQLLGVVAIDMRQKNILFIHPLIRMRISEVTGSAVRGYCLFF